MALAATLLTSAASDTDASSYTTESISPAANSLLVVFVSSGRASLVAPTIAVSGLSLTWATQGNYTFSTSPGVRRLVMATAQCGATPGSGALTITHDATSLVTTWAVIEATGHNTSTPVVQVATNGITTGSATTGTATLASAGHADNRPIAFFYHRINEVTAPRTNWTELADNAAATPGTAAEVQWRADAFETTASATWAQAAHWGGMAAEIAAASVAGPVALDGATSAAATPTAALALAQALAASISTAVTPSAVLAVEQALVGQTDAVSSTAAALAVDQALTGTATATATPTGGLITALAFAGQTAAVASTAASLGLDQSLDGGVSAVSSTTANLGLDQPLAGTAGVVATLAGELAVDRGLNGATTAASSLTGVLTGALEAVALTAAYDNTDASSYNTASISPAANSLLVVFVYSAGTATAPANTVSGLGLTWTQRADVMFSGGFRRVTMLTAQCGPTPGSGALTITSPSSLGDAWSVIQVTSHNQSNPVERVATVNSTDNVVNGTVALAAAANPANRPIAAWATRSNAGIEPGALWTELSDTPGGGPNAGFETQWRSDAFGATASATWTGSSLFGAIAAELNAAVTAGTVTLHGAASGTAVSAGILAVERALTGAVSATSTLTGELAGTTAFGGMTAAASTLTGALSVEQALTGTTSASAVPVGDLGVAAALTGAVASVASPAGQLDAGVGLAGATTAAATLTGAVARTLSLVGATTAAATLTGETGVGRALDGSTEAASTLTVTTLVRDSVLVGAPIVATSAVAGTKFELSLGLYGTVAAASTVAGVMRVVDTLPHLVGPVTAAVVNTELTAAVVTDAAIEVSVPR